MPDFQRVPAPVFPPTICLTCSTHGHPKGFADLLADDPITGRAYMCYGCAEQLIHLFKGFTKDQVDDLTARLVEAHTAISELEAELQHTKDTVITAEDARDALAQVKRWFDAPVEAEADV